jgi:hypothetical protein
LPSRPKTRRHASSSRPRRAAGGFGKALSDVGKIAAGFLTGNLIQGGVSKLTGFFEDSIAAAKESAAVQASCRRRSRTSKETVSPRDSKYPAQIADHNRKAELTLSVRAAHEAQLKAKSGSLEMAQARQKEGTPDLSKENNFAALQCPRRDDNGDARHRHHRRAQQDVA